jgi:hypothetical protein
MVLPVRLPADYARWLGEEPDPRVLDCVSRLVQHGI